MTTTDAHRRPQAEMIAGLSPDVVSAWNRVMCSVRSVAKDDWNDQQKFKFRGVDAVVSAVGPALREHGVSVIPHRVKQLSVSEYQTSRGTQMVNRTVKVVWRVYGPAGDHFGGESFGEAADSGDKSMSKALSVAYRTFLLQALAIPTGDKDPDAEAHERISSRINSNPQQQARKDEVRAANQAKWALRTNTEPLGWNQKSLRERFTSDYDQDLITTRDVELITGFTQALLDEGLRQPDGVQPAKQAEDPDSLLVNQKDLKHLHALFTANKIPEAEKHQWCTDALGLTEPLKSTSNLTVGQHRKLVEKLKALESSGG